MFLSISEAANLIGVSISTMRAWDHQGFLKASFRTSGGHRRYSQSLLLGKFGQILAKEQRLVLAYARVSSFDQKSDLDRQKERLVKHCKNESAPFEVIADLGSGLNYKKRGLKKLLYLLLSGRVSKIVMTHKDRLLRFGSEIIFYLCTFFGTQVELIEADKNLSDNERLAHDVVELITVFSSRLYGKRAHQNKKSSEEKKVSG
ncbi:MAG: IS607 family transposase [Oligoflexales bacterium]|nr:IS607 family transposase [Oligoflexales bacterium]